MTVFVLLEDNPRDALAAVIKREFPDDHLQLHTGHWLIKADGITTQGLCERLGIVEGSGFGGTAAFAVSGYYGLHTSNTWEWLKTKWSS